MTRAAHDSRDGVPGGENTGGSGRKGLDRPGVARKPSLPVARTSMAANNFEKFGISWLIVDTMPPLEFFVRHAPRLFALVQKIAESDV